MPAKNVFQRFIARVIPVIFLMTLMVAVPMFGQTEATGGAIEGTVIDQSGGVVPKANVTAKNVATSLTRSTSTDSTGYYRISALPVGEYDVVVSATGFGEAKVSSVKLTIGQVLTVNFTATVAGQAQSVTITEQAQVVETSRTSVSNTVNDLAVNNLPVNGRNFIDFVLLTPGVTRDVRTGDISFAGQRGTLNSLQIDGADNNNTFFGQTLGRTGSGRAPYQFSQDAVKEFQVNSNGYSAEFGRAGGAVINVVTKSGTNDFHGTAFEFFRDKSMNANDVINKINNRPKSPFHFNQFGGTVGGPIVKDKAFFYFNYDGQRNTQPNLVFLNLPASVPTDAATQAGLAKVVPLSNSWNRTQNQDVFLIKGDWQITTNNRFTARYNHQNFTGQGFENGGPQNASEHTGASLVKTRTLNFSLTSVLNNRTINEARFQYARDSEPGQANSAKPEASVRQGGLTVLTIGRNFFSPRETTINRYQWVDILSRMVGRHNMKFGADFNVDRIFNFFPGNFSGSYTFPTLASFNSGVPSGSGGRYVQAFPGSGTTGPTTHPNIFEFAGFFQDDWRVSSKLTLNFGLRYDIQKFEQPSVKNPDSQLAAVGIDTSHLNIDKNNWAPRFGFAWSPIKNKQFVIRGGYGVFYGRTPSIMVGTAHSNNGINVQTISLDGGVAAQVALMPTYPNILSAIPTGLSGVKPTIFVFSKDYVNPNVQQGSLGLEYGLGRDWSVSAGYLFVKGTHLQRSRDMNEGQPTLTPINIAGTAGAYLRFPSTRPFSNFDRIISFESTANSVYHGLTLQLNKRFSQNFQTMMAYTYGKVIDDVPDATAVVPQSSDDAKFAQTPLNLRDDRSVGVNDQRHRFVWSGYWDLAYARNMENRAAKAILDGWSLAMILTAQTGQPYSGGINVDLNNDGNTRNDRAPNLGRNTFNLPKNISLDPRITRDFRFTEHAKLQFIFESFNFFNRTNINSVRTTLYSRGGTAPNETLTSISNFGQPLGTAGPRIIQLAVKFVF